MPENVVYLRVKLEPGMFTNEFTVTFNVEGREVTSVVSRENVKVEDQPSDREAGHGLLRVRVIEVDRSSSTAVIALPQSSFTSEPRIKVSQEALVPA